MALFVEVREPVTGRLLFRFDPARDLIEYKDRDKSIDVIVDLSRYREGAEPEEPRVISPY